MFDDLPEPPELSFDQQVELALAFAAKSVSARAQTESELRTKLRGKRYPEDVIDEAIERCVHYHLINDAAYATSFVTGRARRGYGPRKVRMDLTRRGIGRELLESSVAEPAWGEACFEALHRKFHATDLDDPSVKAKMQRFLLSRGFSYDQIGAAVTRLREAAE